MDIRLIGLDLDGTVFDSQKRISPRTRSAIAAACARGVAVLPATGRPRAGLPDAFVQIPGVRYAITSNGGAVYDLAGGRCMAVDPLPKEDALWALVRGRELGGLIDVYVEGRAYTGAATFEALVAAAPPAMRTYFSTTRTVVADQVRWLETETRPVEKLTMLFTNEALRDTAFRVYQDSGRFEVTSSIPNNLELNGKGVDKGKALLTLAGLLGLDRSQVMACGDSINDLAMLRAVGLGVAMGNAAPEIAAAADVRTACNDEDGVAKAIEWYVLGQKGED